MGLRPLLCGKAPPFRPTARILSPFVPPAPMNRARRWGEGLPVVAGAGKAEPFRKADGEAAGHEFVASP